MQKLELRNTYIPTSTPLACSSMVLSLNRAIQLNRRGYNRSIRKQRYSMQPKDLVWIGKQIFSVMGVYSKGRYVRLKNCSKDIPTKSVTKMYHFGSFVWN